MQEKDMYRSIRQTFENQGFLTLEQFAFTHPIVKERYRKVDVVAFRWDSNVHLNAIAVEVKPGAWVATMVTADYSRKIYFLRHELWPACKERWDRIDAFFSASNDTHDWIHTIPIESTL